MQSPAADSLVSSNASGEGPDGVAFGRLQSGNFLGKLVEPVMLPDWLRPDEIAEYAAVYSRTGLRGGWNWYRNLARSWELLAPWHGAVIRQPSPFIAGSRDEVLKFPHSCATSSASPTRCRACAAATFWTVRATGFSASVRLTSMTCCWGFCAGCERRRPAPEQVSQTHWL